MTRIEKIKNKLCKIADGMIITSDSNRLYASGFNSSAGYILLSENESTLFLDSRYYEMAKIAQKQELLQPEINIVLAEKKRAEYICEFCERNSVKILAYEDKNFTVFDYGNLKNELNGKCTVIGVGDMIEECRISKDNDEIQKIINAQKITDGAFLHILKYITPNVSEIDVALELEYYMRKNGSSGLAFETICVSGKKSSLPHGKPENIPLGKGFLTMDFGAKYKGYCADMTRTVCIGTPTDEMRKIYNTVLEAQNRAFNEIFAGVTGKRVDAAARDYIYSKGYKGCFGHSTGHSLGIDIHENPNFSPNCNTEIPSNAVLSVEPGIYIEGKFGVRIEDIVKICDFGMENLTKSPKELIII